MKLSWALLLAVVLVSCWLALYRLPFGDESKRYRFSQRLSDLTSLRAASAFAIFATVLYLGLGVAVLLAMSFSSNISVQDFVGRGSSVAIIATLLAILGCSSLNTLCMSVLYKLRPTIDVPGEISQIQWISSILSLPRNFRWLIPAIAALVEELVFRGAIFIGLMHTGASFIVACSASTSLFVIGQIALVSTKTQAIVMGISSVNLGIVGCLLVAGAGSIVPAVILHMSFAGFYTNMSVRSSKIRPQTQRWSL